MIGSSLSLRCKDQGSEDSGTAMDRQASSQMAASDHRFN